MTAPPDLPDTELLDVLIVGAGLSGIGAAHHLQQHCPDHRYLILESRDAIGGTWDLFRYPGIRSDSDMYTLGYRFKPWTQAKAIAGGGSILQYIRETADEAGITARIRFGHTVRSADWSAADACWTLVAVRKADGEALTLRARFLYLCSGYYSYAAGHRPRFENEAEFAGQIALPQFWPQGLAYAGKRVVVIGSGATAITLVPALAETAAHVTMLQRSPTYVVSRPSEDRIATWLMRRLPTGLAYRVARGKSVLVSSLLYRLARRRPAVVKQRIVAMAGKQLGADFDVATHFTPRYDPWDQRVCVAADGDLFRQIRDGRASVVTDTVERFTDDGLVLSSGQTLAADVVVVATGLKLNVLGDIALSIDGRPFDAGKAVSYKGMMLSDLPNMAFAFGYTNASWTLKADLTAAYVCRLLRYMKRHRYGVATPERDRAMATQPVVGFTSGYVQRAAGLLPLQGTKAPWQVHQSYFADLRIMRWGRIADGVMKFQTSRAGA